MVNSISSEPADRTAKIFFDILAKFLDIHGVSCFVFGIKFTFSSYIVEEFSNGNFSSQILVFGSLTFRSTLTGHNYPHRRYVTVLIESGIHSIRPKGKIFFAESVLFNETLRFKVFSVDWFCLEISYFRVFNKHFATIKDCCLCLPSLSTASEV